MKRIVRQVGYLQELYCELPTSNLGRTGFARISSVPPAKYRDITKYHFHTLANPLIIVLSDDIR